MSRITKSQKLLEVAGKTLDHGDRDAAKKVAVMAMRQEDAIDALDRLLPTMNEPEFDVEREGEELSDAQVAKIMTVARELQQMRKFKVATQLLAKIEKIEQSRKRKRRGDK